ncbi:MAG TPA: hypothetical protein VFA27_05545 [Vicinamibacterales bacterium]|nr:hypothetical protein [Vicinamibacterales bacterium]
MLAHALPLEPHEAVAVTQQFLFNRMVAEERISVAEAGEVLDALVAETRQVPAPLRYTVARARGIVEAAPFASVRDLAPALKRFERGDRAAIVRDVLARVPSRRPQRSRALVAAGAIAASALVGFSPGKCCDPRRSRARVLAVLRKARDRDVLPHRPWRVGTKRDQNRGFARRRHPAADDRRRWGEELSRATIAGRVADCVRL